jgi:FKBP-type peptidyl-prolyl cis-trans isomerase
MRIVVGIFVLGLLASCDTSGVKSGPKEEVDQPDKKKVEKKTDKEVDLDADHEVVDEKKLSNGIQIKWYDHGDGDLVLNGDMIDIDYKVYLENGEVIDGNHLRNLPSFPFMVGFQMQKEGWDMALRELRIGDFAEIYLPYQLTPNGEIGIEGLMPPKSNNVIKVRVLGKHAPDREIDGTRVWLMNENPDVKEGFGEGKRILFHCYASSPTNPMYFDTQVQNNPYNYGFDDSGLVPGLHKALINAKKADLMLVHVPASEAYGSKGYQDLVQPDEDIFYRIMVMEVKDK